MRWRCRRESHPGRAVSCSEVNAARIVAAVVEMFRCRPARRSRVSMRDWESRRPTSGLGATVSTASASRLARSVPNAARAVR